LPREENCFVENPKLEALSHHDPLCYSADMSEIVFQISEDDTDGGFTARALGHSIVTEADTWEELRANVREAVRCHFDEGKAPAVIRLHRVMDELLATA
jgi:hypothetical protein